MFTPEFMQIFNSLFAAFWVCGIAYFISHTINDTPKKREAAIEDAIRSGRTVRAELIKTRGTTMSIPGTHEHWSSIGYYKYEYKGKKYKYKYWADNPPPILKLYFVKNPAKATVAGAFCPVTTNWPLTYAIITLVFYFFIYR